MSTFEPVVPIQDVLDPTQFELVVRNILKSRKVDAQDKVSYQDTEATKDEKTYVISGDHVPIEETIKLANSSCKRCYGKGYQVLYLEKAKISNPQDYVILSDKPIESMTEPEKKLWVEVEKKKKLWKIMLPCECALKRMARVDRTLICNERGNVVVRVTYKQI